MSAETDFISTVPMNKVAGLEVLRPSYRSWVDSFLRWETLIAKQKDLKKEKDAIEHLPSLRKEFLDQLRLVFQKHCADQEKQLVEELGPWRNHPNPDPFRNFPGIHGSGLLPYMPIDWNRIERAVNSMPEGISEKERSKRLDDVNERLAKVSAELAEVTPPSRYGFFKGNVAVDLWPPFVDHWRALQSRACKPLGPCGRCLTYSLDDERWAWGKLVGRDYIRPRGLFPAGYESASENDAP